jgi:hypothetical protein
MHSKILWLRIAGTIFGIVAIMHLFRIILNPLVLINSWSLPIWINWIGVPLTGFLSFWLWRLSYKNGNYPRSVFQIIKPVYWALAIFFLIVTIILSVFFSKEKDWANVLLAGLAITIAIIAMGLSDKNLLKFEGKVKLWTDKPTVKGEPKEKLEEKEEEEEVPQEVHYKLSIHIVNTALEPIHDIKIKIRTPHKIFTNYDEKNRYLQKIAHGHTTIFYDDLFGILGNEKNEEYLHYDLMSTLDKWNHDNQGHVYITINGSNIQTSTHILKCNMVKQLKEATENKALYLQPL